MKRYFFKNCLNINHILFISKHLFLITQENKKFPDEHCFNVELHTSKSEQHKVCLLTQFLGPY